MPLFKSRKSTELHTSLDVHPETAAGELKSGNHKFPLQAVDVKGVVRGLLYSATITQKFRNDRDSRMEAVYTFPLPPKAAVHGFTLKIGDRVIQGEIKERGAARRQYAEAIASGHRAALLEEERSDIFTTTVGNIEVDDEIEITFELSGPLSCFKNTARLRLPLVVGEVYIPGRPLDGESVGDGTSVDTDQVPDASRITPPRLADGAPNPVALSLSFEVEPSGLELRDAVSTCHFARTKKYQDGRFQVSLLPGLERMDRAFVLEITYPENMLQTSLLWDPLDKAFALTVVPPIALDRQEYPRDVVILLDRSGSMQGWPMIAARRAAARIVESLNEADRFGIISYDDRQEHYNSKQGLCPADNFHKMRAAEYLAKTEARGGTEMLPALREGLSYFGTSGHRDPHVILITDGDVGNDSALIRNCQTGVRISTIGIGYAAREGVLNRMAETSGGLCSLIPNEADLEKELVEMHRKWGQPIWKGLSLRGQDENFRAPKFWDVWQDVPTTFFGKAELGEVTEVNGWFADRGQHTVEVAVVATDDPVVRRAWARSRLLDLEDLFLVNKATPKELIALSVSAQVLCRFTAFSAVDTTETVKTEQELERVVQPVEKTILERQRSAAPSSLGGSSPCDMEFADACYTSTARAFSLPEGAPGIPVQQAPSPALYESDFESDPFGSDDCYFEDLEPSPPPPPPSPPARKSGLLGRIVGHISRSKPAPSPRPTRSESEVHKEKKAELQTTFFAEIVKQLKDFFDRLQRQSSQFGRESDTYRETAITTIIDIVEALSSIARGGVLSSSEGLQLREIMVKLIDYKEALEMKSPSADEIRRELEKTVQSLE